MADPYKILGVSRNATDEEVKSAYKELIKKYHPDNYSNNPLSDLATEKMQEVNVAYDEIMNSRKNNSSSGYSSSSYDYTNSNSQLNYIRQMINTRKITQAEAALDGIEQSQRTAEWYFLKGTIYQMRGWLDEAYNCFDKAVTMDNSNAEYRAAYNRLSMQKNGNSMNGNPYQTYRTNNSSGGCSSCDMCSGLICADCCCECCGVDLISCC
ncbi:MAG: J domain-containing protein [Oscillospiraceae bacterium]